jgi:hypothetical protein
VRQGTRPCRRPSDLRGISLRHPPSPPVTGSKPTPQFPNWGWAAQASCGMQREHCHLTHFLRPGPSSGNTYRYPNGVVTYILGPTGCPRHTKDSAPESICVSRTPCRYKVCNVVLLLQSQFSCASSPPRPSLPQSPFIPPLPASMCFRMIPPS